MSYTKGPWKFDTGTQVVTEYEHEDSLYPDGRARIADVTPKNYTVDSLSGRTIGGEWDEETEANARLIAAAPALLEALQGLFEHCAMIHKHWGDNGNAKEARAAEEAARAAIEQATGGE